MQLKLNNLNLNTGWYLTEEIVFDSNPPIEFSDISFASYDGAKFISSKYTPKTLTIRGRISQSTVALLEAEMDNFKKTLLSTPNINLNFSYANSFRQYVGNVKNLTLTREKFHVTYCPFEITFIAEDPPFSYDISSIDQVAPNLSEVFSSDAIVGNAYSHTLTMSGTAPPLARWTYLLDAISGKTNQVIFKSLTTGKQLAINAGLSAGDEIIIDQKNLDVFLNAQERDYDGVFPAFNLGGNEFEFQIYGVGGVASGLFLDQSQSIQEINIVTPADPIVGVGQIFQAGYTGDLGRLSVLLRRDSSGLNPTYITLYLYSVSSGLPNALLATSSNTIYSNNIPRYEYSWFDFNFNYAVTSGTSYAIVMTQGSSDIVWGADNHGYYSNGSRVSKWKFWSYWLAGNQDMCFKTYIKTTGTGAFNHTSSLKIEQEKRFL